MIEDDLLYVIEDEDDVADNASPGYSRAAENTDSSADVMQHGEEDLPYAFGKEDPDAEETEEDAIAANPLRGKRNPLLMLLAVMLWPATAWKDMKRSKTEPQKFAITCFLPLCLTAAVTLFINFLYQANQSFGELLADAVTIFFSFVFSYFLIPVLGRPFLNEKVNDSLGTNFGKNFLMTALSTLAMFKVLYNLLPGLEPVIVFLPLWTIYLVHKVVPLLRAPKDKQPMTSVILCILIIGLPTGWTWLLEQML